MNTDTILGIDVGGTGIKGAVVNTRTGELLTERIKVMTPRPATPKAVAKALRKLVDQIGWKGDYIGCGFPAIIKKQVAHSAANVHKNWIGTNVAEVFGKVVPGDFFVLNDADAAGLAEMRMGAGKKCNGVALMITIGTGLGSALFSEKVLVPNTEVGHVLFHGEAAEKYASNSVRKKQNLDWETWGRRLNEYLAHLERVLSPDLFILGGGVCKKIAYYEAFLTIKTPVKRAVFQNNAGIIGAAMYAAEQAQVVGEVENC